MATGAVVSGDKLLPNIILDSRPELYAFYVRALANIIIVGDLKKE